MSQKYRPKWHCTKRRGHRKELSWSSRYESATGFVRWRNSLKKCLPPKMKGFIIKRQAKLTLDQAKHFHFYMPTRELEADRVVEALNRLDHTDALVEQILGDRAKLEQSSCRVHAHTSHFVQHQPSRSATSEEVEPIHYPIHTTESESESELDWDPECVDDGTPWLTRTGQLRYLFRETDHWMNQKQVRCQPGHKVTDRPETICEILLLGGHYKPDSSRFRMKVRKTLFAKKHPRRD